MKLTAIGIIALSTVSSLIAQEVLFKNSDFEVGTLENWTAKGNAFKMQPTKGDNPKARGRGSSRHQGEYWIGTFEEYDGRTGKPGATRGDTPTGTLTSIPFVIKKPYITFRVGAGDNENLLGVRLLCEGKEIMLATGNNSESMDLVSIDVKKHIGKKAQLVIFDNSSGGWGHINVDDFRGTEKKVEMVPCKSMATFESYIGTGYDQKYRPQFHFTSLKNWLNDPNGMVYYDGEYHLFFQHNPKGNKWGNMTWGHAVSKDMMHWKQLPHAILPYGRGTIFSGTAAVDNNNTLGKQEGDVKTIVAAFTLARKPHAYQGLAYSTDKGRTFKLVKEGKAIVPYQGLDQCERDPKILWHEPSKKWVMILWLKRGKPGKVRFFTSDNLIEWKKVSDFDRDWVFECMDLVHLPVDGDKNNKKWLFYDASFEYEIGKFDGKTFTSDRKVGRGDYGTNYYAAQTFNNSPDGRTVIIGWMRNSDFRKLGMPFNEQMSFPSTMDLRTTADGLKLYRWPIKEIESLYTNTHKFDNKSIAELSGPLGKIKAELVDLSIEFTPGKTGKTELNIRGLKISYADKHFIYGKTRLPAPPVKGKVKLRVLVDRGSIEMFANDGATVASCFALPSPDNKNISIDGNGTVDSLFINELKSTWK